jgi:MerR family transcriptional regulator, redox-sensitive transcriptional activator SoxR
MTPKPAWITIGGLASRSGVRTSALRFYEEQGLITSERTDGNQRRYPREALRRVAVIRAAQVVGLSLQQIRATLDSLPNARTPSHRDWEKLSATWQGQLDDRIEELQRLRDKLSGCIGCGCLSLEKCALFNKDDQAASGGSGARYLLGDEPGT